MDRLNKILAHAGLGSRRHCEGLILAGRVAVDGATVRELGTKVDLDLHTVFVDGKPIQNQFKALSELPGLTPLSEKISKDLKKRGFAFVGPTGIYAYMQSVGIVNDHVIGCFRHAEVQK